MTSEKLFLVGVPKWLLCDLLLVLVSGDECAIGGGNLRCTGALAQPEVDGFLRTIPPGEVELQFLTSDDDSKIDDKGLVAFRGWA